MTPVFGSVDDIFLVRSRYERKDVKYREDIKHAKEQSKTLQKTVAKEQAKATKAESDSAEYTTLLEKSEADAAVLSETVEVEQAKVDEIYEGLKGETEALRGALEAKKQELAPFKQESDQCRSQVRTVPRVSRVFPACVFRGVCAHVRSSFLLDRLRSFRLSTI